jgi:hypothetical protein
LSHEISAAVRGRARRGAGAAIVACLAAGAVAVTGCGSSNSSSSAKSTTTPQARTVDTAAVESGIEKQLSTTNAKVTHAMCPTDEKSEKGATFTCSVTWDNGATGKVKVTETSVNHFIYEPVSGSVQVPGSTVEKQIQAELAKQGAPDAQADCPNNVIVKVGTTVTCNLSTAGGASAGTVTYTFSSAEGTVDPSSVKTTG